jgi:hypothetical protein
LTRPAAYYRLRHLLDRQTDPPADDVTVVLEDEERSRPG